MTGGSFWLLRNIFHKTEVLYSRVVTQEVEAPDDSNEREGSKEEILQANDFYSLITSLAIFSCILGYFYLCDRYLLIQ